MLQGKCFYLLCCDNYQQISAASFVVHKIWNLTEYEHQIDGCQALEHFPFVLMLINGGVSRRNFMCEEKRKCWLIIPAGRLIIPDCLINDFNITRFSRSVSLFISKGHSVSFIRNNFDLIQLIYIPLHHVSTLTENHLTCNLISEHKN